MVAALAVRDVTWGPTRCAAIVDGIDFELAPQEVLAIVGPNGAGKSSLLRCLYRVNRPWRGSIQVYGEDVWRMPPREAARRIAAVPQDVPADFPFRVRDVVMMGRTARRRARAAWNPEDRAKVGAAMERLDLGHLAERLFTTLSGGEKQRVLIARALAQEPNLIILDEPTNHLDIRHQLEILRLLRDLGLSVVTTLHDLNLAAAFADRVLLLDKGRLVGAGRPDEILTAEAIRSAFEVEAAIDRHPWVAAPRFSFHLTDGKSC
jgi:iron complex transport system ATP-binding protein